MAKKVTREEFRKARNKRAVNISQTMAVANAGGPKGKATRVYGPKGKLYTGRVQMSDGSIAVYKDGKRIEKGAKPTQKPMSAKGKARPAAPAKAKATTSRVSPSARGEGAGRTRAASARMGSEGPKNTMPVGKRSVKNYGNVRGVGSMQGMTAAQKSKRLKEAEAKRRYDRSPAGQRKNAAGILGLTGAAALAAGTPLGVGAAAAGARAAGSAAARTAAGASRVTRPVLGGTSKSGRSTSNKAAVAAFKAQKRLEAVKKALAKKRKK